MKKTNRIISCVILVLAVIAAVGSISFFGPCVHEDGNFGACHWAGQALFGTSLLLVALSAASLVLKDRGVLKGLGLAILFTAILGIFIPGTLIDLCGMATMRCRAVMRPALTILNVLMGVGGLATVVLNKG